MTSVTSISASLSLVLRQARSDLTGLGVVLQLLIQAQCFRQQFHCLPDVARALTGSGETPERGCLTMPVGDITPDSQRVLVAADGILDLVQAEIGIAEIAERIRLGGLVMEFADNCQRFLQPLDGLAEQA